MYGWFYICLYLLDNRDLSRIAIENSEAILPMGITLAKYIHKRNGVPPGNPRSLRNMLYRSLGAKSFDKFWNYWNPIFGYYLGYYVFKPLKKVVSPAIALLLTFVFCGAIHDGAVMLFKGGISVFFMVWFLFMGVGVFISKLLKHDLSALPWLFRAIYNLSYIGISFYVAAYVDFVLSRYMGWS